jgi:hypothetical protein
MTGEAESIAGAGRAFIDSLEGGNPGWRVERREGWLDRNHHLDTAGEQGYKPGAVHLNRQVVFLRVNRNTIFAFRGKALAGGSHHGRSDRPPSL